MRKITIFFVLVTASLLCHAIIIIPIPNLAFPGALGKIRDALEKSSDTKALATVGEEKVFGSRYWVWGNVSGKMTQADADDQAMKKCMAGLQTAKSQTVGGQPLYNFGTNTCELYKFLNPSLNLPDPVQPTQAPVAASTPEVERNPTPASVPKSADAQDTVPAPKVQPPPLAVTTGTNTVQQSSTTKSGSDIVQKMRDLDALYKQNLINQSEYEAKKKQLLDSM